MRELLIKAIHCKACVYYAPIDANTGTCRYWRKVLQCDRPVKVGPYDFCSRARLQRKEAE